MTNDWDYEENTQLTSEQGGPKPLRDAYKAQLEANKKLMERLEALEAENTRNRVANLFESQGVPRSAAQYYNGDADPEKVSAFVTEMRAAFTGATAVQQSAVPAPSTDDVNKLQNLMQAGADGNTGTSYDIAMSKMNDPSLSTADRIAAYQEFMRNNK